MHKSRRLVWLIFLIVLLANVIVVINCERSKATGRDIFVDDNNYLYHNGTAEYPYKTINDALKVAEDGDTIFVFGGIYNETLNINKRVTLVGSIEEGDSIITYGSDHKYTIEITADNVNFSGFTIHDLGNAVISQIGGALIHVTSSNVIIQNNNITNCTNGWGIYLDSSGNQLIKNNKIERVITGVYASSSNTNDFVGNKVSNCTSFGIAIASSHYNTLYNNIFERNYYGIYSKNSENINISYNNINANNGYGIGIYGGNYNNIAYNSILYNFDAGVYISSPNSYIFGNAFEGNQLGIRIDASNCNIYSNFINGSLSKGIYATSGTKGNTFYLNYLQRNVINALDQGSNKWYSDGLMKGNYWDDYRDADWIPGGNGDGIGDVPYQKNGIYDKYPLGLFAKPPNKPSNPSPQDGQDNVGLKITLSVKVTHPDGLLMNVYFYRKLGESIPDEELGYNMNLPDGSTAVCSFNLNYTTNFVWFVVVNDSKLENQSDIWFFNTKARPATNIPPVAVANGPNKAILDKLVVFDASGSYDPDGSIEFYRWNFGDGTSEILSISPSHIYSSKVVSIGTRDVTLTVIDNNGSSSNKIIKVNIVSNATNILPVANAGGPYSGYVDTPINFVSSGSTDQDEDGSIVSWNWTFDDGGSSPLPNPSYSYKQAGTYTVTLTVTDDQGGTNTVSTGVTISAKTSGGSPGFELVIALIAIALVLIWRRRKL